MKKGLLIVYSGPSGVGKSTVREVFMKDETLNLTYSISMTTREPREGEQEGVDYFFVSKEEFETAIEKDELLEYAKYVDNYYGTPKAYVEKLRNEGKNVILEIDYVGALNVMAMIPETVSIFVTPPSVEELERRLEGRGTDSKEVIAKRIEKAKEELCYADRYKYQVCNIDVEDTAKQIAKIIRKEMKR